MKPELIRRILKLNPKIRRVYGPYTRASDARRIVILYDGTKRSARLLAKVKLEVKIGRLLRSDETVDHKDEDKTNDRYANLQVLSLADNARKSVRAKHKTNELICVCGKKFYRPASRLTKRNFCSHSCRSKTLKANQYTK